MNRMKSVDHLKDFKVLEFRRYAIKAGEREHFAQYFESFFPDAFQQLGAIAVGEFFERKNNLAFTWIRGFHDMDDRAKINAAFYYGPLWKEHKQTLNGLMTDSDNVLLLRPLRSEEHTSELQSHLNIVSRLLLEKKKGTSPAVRAHTVRSMLHCFPSFLNVKRHPLP